MRCEHGNHPQNLNSWLREWEMRCSAVLPAQIDQVTRHWAARLHRVIKTPGVSLSIREPYFLSSPRFKMPAEGMSYANLHLCAIDGCHQPRPAQGSSIASATGGGGASILHPARTTFAALRAALAGAERADVLHVSGEDLAEIDLHDWPRYGFH